jgi:hypothetical protein
MTNAPSAQADTAGVVHVAQLDAAGVLALWDLGSRLAPAERATAALGVALPGRSWSELGEVSLGLRDRLLLGLLGVDASSTIEGVFDCPDCAETMELSVPCGQFLNTAASPEPEAFKHDGWLIRWRLPNGEDMAAASRLEPYADAAAHLFARCVLDVTGPAGCTTLADTPPAVRAGLVERIEAWDALTDIRLDAVCPNCDAPHSVDLDIPTLAWDEITARAHALLREVHLLARAYGWTESEVMALSTRRRRAYLRLADA